MRADPEMAKRYLSAYLVMETELVAALGQVERLAAMLKAAGGEAGAAGRLAALKAETADRARKLTERRREMSRLIGSLPGWRERAVLELRYVNGWTFPEIAAQLGREQRTIFYAHSRGLAQAAEMLALPGGIQCPPEAPRR